MKRNMIVRAAVILLILAISISCDQVSKSIVRSHIQYNEQINVLQQYVILTKVENTGAFLSLGNELPKPIKLLVMIALPLLALGFGIVYIITHKSLSKITTLSICLMIGGGIGNIFDRMMYGSVTDFLHIDFVIFHTGIFNLADVSLMTGVFMIIIEYLFTQRRTAKA